MLFDVFLREAYKRSPTLLWLPEVVVFVLLVNEEEEEEEGGGLLPVAVAVVVVDVAVVAVSPLVPSLLLLVRELICARKETGNEADSNVSEIETSSRVRGERRESIARTTCASSTPAIIPPATNAADNTDASLEMVTDVLSVHTAELSTRLSAATIGSSSSLF